MVGGKPRSPPAPATGWGVPWGAPGPSPSTAFVGRAQGARACSWGWAWAPGARWEAPGTKPLGGGPWGQLGLRDRLLPRASAASTGHRGRRACRGVRGEGGSGPADRKEPGQGGSGGRLRLGRREGSPQPFLAYFLLAGSRCCRLGGWVSPAHSPVSGPQKSSRPTSAPPASSLLERPPPGPWSPLGGTRGRGQRLRRPRAQ